MEYSIWIDGKEVPVSEKVYRVYWKGVRKERYFAEGDIHNHVFSYDALDTQEMNGKDLVCRDSDISVEEQVIRGLEETRLYDAMARLSEDEYYIIERIYFDNMSLRKLSQESGIPLSTLYYRHQRILRKLRGLFGRTCGEC